MTKLRSYSLIVSIKLSFNSAPDLRSSFLRFQIFPTSTKSPPLTTFEKLKLYRICVDIPEYNQNARTLFDHAGFKHEGTLRKSRPHEGARFNSVIMGILSQEYKTLYQAGISSYFN